MREPKAGESQQEAFCLCHKLGSVSGKIFNREIFYYAKGLQHFWHPTVLSEYTWTDILNDTFGCCKKPLQTVLCTAHVMMMNHISRDFSPSFSLSWMQ